MYTKPHSLHDAILKYAKYYLHATPDNLRTVEQGLCYGLASVALVYHALGRFKEFQNLLQSVANPSAPVFHSVQMRALIEALFYLQSVELQTAVSGTSWSAQRLSAQEMLTDISLDSFFMKMDYQKLVSFLAQYGSSITGVLLRANPAHVVAILKVQNCWYCIDSLKQTVPSFHSVQDAVAHVSMQMRVDISIVVVLPVGLLPTLPDLMTVSQSPLYTAMPWQELCYGQKCKKCGTSESWKFYARYIDGVAVQVCDACRQEEKRQKEQVCKNCGKTKKWRFYTSNIEGVQGLVCEVCWLHNKPPQECPKCEIFKSGKFFPSNIKDLAGRICEACWRREKVKKEQLCGNCRLTKPGDFHPSNIKDVAGPICQTCWLRHRPPQHCAECGKDKPGKFLP